MRSSTQYTKGRDPEALFPRRRHLNSALRRLRLESAPGLLLWIARGRQQAAVRPQMRASGSRGSSADEGPKQ